jgi:GTPase
MSNTNLPSVAIIGTPNAGKSSLFNKIAKQRIAIVSEVAGVTRDRNYANITLDDTTFILVDTGGLSTSKETMQYKLNEQTRLAIDECTLIVFLIDAVAGITPDVAELAKVIRKLNKPYLLVANKTENNNSKIHAAELHNLALGAPIKISAAHNQGINELKSMIVDNLIELMPDSKDISKKTNNNITLALIGKPNTGKSTLINTIVGTERMITSDVAGTTRDSIAIDTTVHGKNYTIIDTAGIRRKTKVKEKVERFSVIRSLGTVSNADIVIYLVDPNENITDQDLKLLSYILDEGKALIIAINKSDLLDNKEKRACLKLTKEKLEFLEAPVILTISAAKGYGLHSLWQQVSMVYECANMSLQSNKLNHLLTEAIDANPPPMINGRRIKMQFAHPGGVQPLRIIIHGRQVDKVSQQYKRYLRNYFIRKLAIKGTPLQLFFKVTNNPFNKK